MAAFKGWIDANVGALPQKRGFPSVAAGGLIRSFCQSWAKKTTDGDGSLYFVAEVPSDAILTSLLFNMDAIASLTSQSFGIFKLDKSLSNLGTVSSTSSDYYAGASTTGTPNSTPVDASAILCAATDTHNGYAVGSELNCLSAVPVQTITSLGAATYGMLNFGIKLWQLLGFTDPKWKDDSYIIGSLLTTAGANAGNMVLRGTWLQG